MLTENEKTVLRKLAERYMDVAALPVQKEKIELWKSLNRGEMRRPMFTIDQLPWHELDFDGSLTCAVADPFWRGVEENLRQQLYKWTYFPADMVIEPFIDVPMSVGGRNYGLEIIEEKLATDDKNSVVAHRYINQFREESDIDKIRDMALVYDTAATAAHAEQAESVFGGVAPVRLTGIQFHLGVWDALTTLMGVENIYYDTMDRPEFLKRLMDRITDATIAGIKQAEELGVHDVTTNSCHCSHIYTDDLLPSPNVNLKQEAYLSETAGNGAGRGPGRASGNLSAVPSAQSAVKTPAKHCWAYGLAQLFSSVPPSTFEELELPYIQKMGEMFGCIYYGCCDRLDDRLDLVKKIPNVRKVSCSPWSDREKFAERIGPKLVMSNKPSPAYLASDIFDEKIIRDDLNRTINAARKNKVNLEFILKDVSTVQYQPERLTRWSEIAREAVES